MFEYGTLGVDAHDVALQRFLDVHPWNMKNGGKGPVQFFEYDAEAEAKKEVDSMLLEANAVKEALDADIATTEAVLRPILGGSIHEYKTDRLTRELLLYAKKQPAEFLASIKNDKLLMENVAYTAIDFHIAKLVDNGTVFQWVDSGKKIVAIPVWAESL